jgi:ubiquinone/menaquinone biosynthesis C-methylase UbiE
MKDKIKEAVKAYDKIASIYTDYNFEKVMQFQLTKFISLLKGKRVLDAGCGVGRDVEYLMEDGLEVVGVDISENMIKQAKKNVPKGKFKVMDFREMKFKDSSFDGVWAMASVYHISNKEILKTFKEFYRILDKNGLFYVSVYEGDDTEERKDSVVGEVRTFYSYKEDEMKKYVEDAGFTIIRSEVNQTEDRKWLEVYARKE